MYMNKEVITRMPLIPVPNYYISAVLNKREMKAQICMKYMNL